MHKLAAFCSYIHRLLNIPLSPENYQKELSFTKQIAVNNGYKAELLDKMVQNKLLKLALALVYLPRMIFLSDSFTFFHI